MGTRDQISEEERRARNRRLGLEDVEPVDDEREARNRRLGITGEQITQPAPDEGRIRRDAILARQGFAPPGLGIPEFLPGVEPKPQITDEAFPRGNEALDAALAGLSAYQRFVSDPITATALSLPIPPGIPGLELLGSPRGFRPELVPGIGEDFRGALAEQPLRQRLAADILLDPLNIPPIGAARGILRGASAARGVRQIRPGLQQAAQQVGQVRPPPGVAQVVDIDALFGQQADIMQRLREVQDEISRLKGQKRPFRSRIESLENLARDIRRENTVFAQQHGETLFNATGQVDQVRPPPGAVSPVSTRQLALPPAPAPRIGGAIVSPGQVPQAAPRPSIEELLRRGGYRSPRQSAEAIRLTEESASSTMRGLAREFEGANEDLLARFSTDDIEDRLGIDLPRIANSDEVDNVAAAKLLRSEADSTERRLARTLRRMEEADITARETAIQRGLETVAPAPVGARKSRSQVLQDDLDFIDNLTDEQVLRERRPALLEHLRGRTPAQSSRDSLYQSSQGGRAQRRKGETVRDMLVRNIEQEKLIEARRESLLPEVVEEQIVEQGPGPLAPPIQQPSPGSRARGDIPFEASTPEEASQFRQRVRELPAAQRTHMPPPEEVVTRPQAQEALSKEFYDAIMDSPTDIAATAYFKTGKIVDYIRRTPKTFEVAPGFAESTFQEVGRASAFLSDPTRLVESIDLNGFGRALQQGLLWPTRRTVLASVNWGDATKVDFRKMLDRHGIRGTNPIRTRQKLDAAGDVLEEIGTNELDVGIDLLIAQTDNLLTDFSQIERVQIVNVAVDTRRLMDNLLRIQNATRTRRGQSAIGRVQNYLPHIRQSNVWSRLGLSRLPSKEITEALPPPDFIKPNTAFNPRALTRTGGLEGYEKIRNIERLINDYIETARKDIFYTNIIQNGKAHIKALRARGGLDNSAEAIEEWIMESYAGKLPAISRVASKAGRVRDAALLLRRSLTRSVFPLNWTWNAFVQTSSMGLTIKRYGPLSTIQGLDFLANGLARKAVRQNAYSSIIKRRGAGKAALQDVGPGIGDTAAVQRSALDTVEGAANFFTNIIEDNLTGISVRAAYHDGVRRGLTGRPLWEYASEGGSKTQSMYNLEDLPGILRAKEVGAVFPFQTFAFEVMNTVRESGIPGLGRVGTRVERNRMVSLLQFFGAIVATNVAIDKISGRSPWQLSSFIPFWSIIGAGVDSGNTWNYPLPIKYAADFNKAIQDVGRHGNFQRLVTWALRYHMPAGTQIERMVRGIKTVVLDEGEVSSVIGRELFTIDVESAQEITKAIVGGIYTTSPGKEYVDQLQEAKGPGFRFTGIPIRKFFPSEGR